MSPFARYHMPVDTRESVKRAALEVGFDLVGIAPALPGRDLHFAREWIERGFGGEMLYLANPKRFDPSTVLPSVKSVICVGLIYDTPFPYSTEVRSEGVRSQESGVRMQRSVVGASGFAGSVEGHDGQPTTSNEPTPTVNQPSPFGRGWTREAGTGEGDESRVSNFDFPISHAAVPRAWISRYAWGRDYHEIMREKLERLRDAIEELAPGTETRVFVDTGPVVERAFARFSGLGWMGKNTCIINEEKGSWLFLGVILTNLELEPDLPAPDRCGTCRACLEACPTGALVEPYVMDASRCISYLTIELKGSIPVELRPRVGVNVFGCDICQDVCPWNRRSQESGVRSQESWFRPMVITSSTIGTPLPTNGEGLRTKDEGQGSQQSAVSSRQSDNPQSSIFNHQSSAPRTQHPEPSTFSLFSPPLKALAALTEGDFRRIFACSPIKRTKYRGWLRNLCVAMGNSGDRRFISWLEPLAQGDDAILREHAEWALERTRQV